MGKVIDKPELQDPPHWVATTTTPEPHHSAEEEHVGQRPPSDDQEPETQGSGRRSMLIGTLIVLVLLGGAVYFGIHSRSTAEHKLEQATESAAIPTVNVIHPLIGSKAQEVVLPGNTQAFIDTSIYARTNGYLKQWFVDIGSHVHQGELLAVIDAPEIDQQLQQAEADLKTSQANQQLAETTNVRWQALVAKHAVSQQEADQVASDYSAKQAATAAAEANVRRLRQLQSYERVTAPFDGVITARSTDVGSLIDAGSSAEPHELFHLDQVGKLRVFVSVPEVYAESVRDGAQVDITQDADPAHVIRGTVARNSNSISQTSRTLNVEVDVDNANGILLPGAYVFAHMKLPAGSNTVTIPSNTLIFRSQGLQVGVVRNGRVQLMPITIGHDFGNTVEVTSGISPNDEVILDPSDSLITGAQVEVGSATGSVSPR
ncbi:MAG TPA: efflux RND transporter periplasmic adaptor subunit [Acidobacteriaceae bacterium]|jgi:RND family efflux transporter MFP subunit